MSPLAIGDVASPVPGVSFEEGPVGLYFFKVTCPTCQMAAPSMDAFEAAVPGRVIGVGQDPSDALSRFTDVYGMGIASIEDPPPYPISDAYAVVSVPTLYVIDTEGIVADVVGAWDRAGFNRVGATLAGAAGVAPFEVSVPGDGLPAFQPG